MKRLLLYLIIIPVISISQNYVITPQNPNPSGNPGDLLWAPVLVQNITSDSISFEFDRTYLNIPAGWQSCVCLPVCLNPHGSMHYRFVIPANSAATVEPNFQTDTIPGIGYSTFIFWETGKSHKDTLNFSGSTLAMAGIKSFSKNTIELNLYPNPANGSITVSYNIENNQNGKIEIFSMKGQKIKDLTISPILSGKQQTKIDIESFPNGIYYLKISLGVLQKTLQFIVSN